jgi:hypothetical protein
MSLDVGQFVGTIENRLLDAAPSCVILSANMQVFKILTVLAVAFHNYAGLR